MNLNRARARARRIEDSLRETAFLPLTVQINGVTVKQFTLRHFTILSKIRSPFLVGGPVMGEDIATFLWVVSPQYSAEPRIFVPKSRWRRWRMKARRQRYPTVREVFMAELVLHPRWRLFCRAIDRYLDRAFMDRPPSVEGGKFITASYAAAIIHRVGKRLTREETMETPLAAVFQLIKWRDAEDDPKTPQFNPLQSQIEITADRFRLRHAG